MEPQITSNEYNIVDELMDHVGSGITSTAEDAVAVASAEPTHPLDAAIPVEALIVDAMGSGDAPPPLLMVTARDVQDMILPDPSIADMFSSTDMADREDSASGVVFNSTVLVKLKDNQVPRKTEDQSKRDRSLRLSGDDVLEIQKLCTLTEKEVGECEVKFNLAKAEALFRCETCLEMPMSSETVHTCDFGHQVCGCCYERGVRTCVLCKGHLRGNNVPMENVLRRLRQNYPHMFNKASASPEGVDHDCVSRFYSLKPLECPEDGCRCQSSARSLPTHFKTEHRHVPTIDVSLYKPCTVLISKRSLETFNGNVIALINLRVTDQEVVSESSTDRMTCWVHCGPVMVGNDKVVAVWVSCAYEEVLMPPVLYNVRVSNSHGYSSFAGQMITLHNTNKPASVLADGRCLLLFPSALQNRSNEENIVVELTFYLR